MKTLFSFQVILFTLILFGTATLAQITITSADASAINAVVNVITNHYDSLTTSIDIGAPGATSWDFSALNSYFTITFTSVLPSSTPYYSSYFPASNVVFTFPQEIGGGTVAGWQYSTQNPGDFLMDGVIIKMIIGDTLLNKSVYSPAQVFYPLPYTHNSQWNSSFTITDTTYFNGVPFDNPTIANHTETVLVDAWGNMTLPSGVVLQALRVRRDGKYTSPSFPFYKRTISYSFATKSGAVLDIVASDMTAPNSGLIQTDGVTWSSTNTVRVENEDQIPTQYFLSQNYPNLFNPSTKIECSIPEDVNNLTLTIYNALGQRVEELVNSRMEAGRYSYVWTAGDIATGLYIYELRTNKFVLVKKMMLIK